MKDNPHNIIPELTLNWKMAEDILTRFISTEVRRAGFDKIVIGLSGGIDSALAAFLAVKALGEDNVLAYSMPYKTSSPESTEHACEMADFLEIPLQTIDISAPVDRFFDSRPGIDALRKGNVMARMRMITLFDAAAENNALVLGTGNKTEILLGYSTLFGDSACSLNPVGDLYKTQVWAFSAFLNLPESVIAKAPSADLWIGQTDEDELGVSYELADAILHKMIDLRKSVHEIAVMGFKKSLIELIAERVRKNHFKRVLPPVAKISPRTAGSDLLYSRDWGT